MQQPDDAARHAFGIGYAIIPQSLPQIPRLAHIQNTFRRAAKEIHARSHGQRGKELLTEPLHERFRRIKQPELTDSHAPISAGPNKNEQKETRKMKDTDFGFLLFKFPVFAIS